MVEKAVPQLWTDLSVGCWFEVEVWFDCFWIAVACLTYVTGWACIRSCDSKEQETLKWGDTRKRCVTCQWESYIWVELQQLWCPGVSIVVSEGWVCLIKVVLQTTPEQPLAYTDDLIKNSTVRRTLNNILFVPIVLKSFCSRVLLTLTVTLQEMWLHLCEVSDSCF